ncbi:MAG: hypothetical protein M0R73_07970 [Dehalococcoidia bacterium]|nr:hypothetical protein [Dehalococcoidia bacterium]
MRVRALAVLAAAFLLVSACDSGESAISTPTSTPVVPTATVTLTVSPTPSPRPTAETPRTAGDPDVDAIIEAVEARDLGALSAYIEMQTEACTHALGIGGPPKCAPEQPEGERVEAFPVSSCEAEWHTQPVLTLGLVLQAEQGLYAVAEAPDGFDPSFGGPEVDTLVVFHADRHQGGFRLNLTDGRITSLTMGCDTMLENFVSQQGQAFPLVIGPFDAQPSTQTSAPATGIEALDHALAGVARYDLMTLTQDALRAMEETPAVACQEEILEGSTAECDPKNGEVDGTPVHVFPSAYCHGVYSRSPQALLAAFLDQAPVLHSIYQAPSEPSPSANFPHSEWWVVY